MDLNHRMPESKSGALPLGERPAETGRGTWPRTRGLPVKSRLLCQLSYTPNESGVCNKNPRPQPWQGCALPTELCPRIPGAQSGSRTHTSFDTATSTLRGCQLRHLCALIWWGRMDSNHRVFRSLVYSQVQSTTLPHPQVLFAPEAGLEPATHGLTVRCSTD